MDIKNLAYNLRMVLFNKHNCDELMMDFKRVLKMYECDYEVNIIEDNKSIIVDIVPCIQFIKRKGKVCKIYELIPFGSPLTKYKEKTQWQKKKFYHSKPEEKKMIPQESSI